LASRSTECTKNKKISIDYVLSKIHLPWIIFSASFAPYVAEYWPQKAQKPQNIFFRQDQPDERDWVI
jgi:hypothetical protein